ncbi:MAG: ankyrin repeat domain-containing protein [Elusimicrobia bacterium]|nr:ankyrin repeat domain-containing protein [Elusimicrobiota bacterium]
MSFPAFLAAALLSLPGTAWPAPECALAAAAAAGDAGRVSELLASGADLDCPGAGPGPVQLAVSRWIEGKGGAYKEIVVLLLSRGAKLEDHGPAFDHAMWQHDADIAPLLRPGSAKVRAWAWKLAYQRGDARRRTPESLRLIGLLLDKGAPIRALNPKSGDTLLHIAVQFRDPALARLLMSRGADPMAKRGGKGVTPLGMAEAGLKAKNAKTYRELLGILREPGRE